MTACKTLLTCRIAPEALVLIREWPILHNGSQHSQAFSQRRHVYLQTPLATPLSKISSVQRLVTRGVLVGVGVAVAVRVLVGVLVNVDVGVTVGVRVLVGTIVLVGVGRIVLVVGYFARTLICGRSMPLLGSTLSG